MSEKSNDVEIEAKESIIIDPKSKHEIGSRDSKDKNSVVEEFTESTNDKKLESMTDPLKDSKRMKTLKRYIRYLCVLVLGLAVKSIILGLLAYSCYEDKQHFQWFGGLCILQLIGAPIGWSAIKFGNRILFWICVVINIIWIIAVIVLLLYFWLIKKSVAFNQEIALHVGAVFFIGVSIILAILCFLIIRQWNQISIEYKSEELYVLRPKKYRK